MELIVEIDLIFKKFTLFFFIKNLLTYVLFAIVSNFAKNLNDEEIQR